MKLFRVVGLGLLVSALFVGCGPKNVDNDPEPEELSLTIDEGDSSTESSDDASGGQ